MNTRTVRQASLLLLLLCTAAALAAPEGKGGRKGGRDKQAGKQPSQNSICNDVPAHPVDIILARPKADSVTLSVLAYEDMEGSISYGVERGQAARKTITRKFAKGEPTEVVLESLKPNSRYTYQFRGAGGATVEGGFRTQRPRGSSFTFTITADSHLDDRTTPEVYLRTLAHALADEPDFHIDLGDTFMTEKHENRENAARQYLAQRYYFGQLCRAAPLFFVLGNHDGESPRGRDGESDSLAAWSNTMRKRYFANPVPDAFYTGNANKHPELGLLQDYYAWHWGDALFVVLDPFWHTIKTRGKGDNWKRSLGTEQYQWLRRTLERSKAKFKFVFIHHLVGGATPEGRGGAEAAAFYEWGGKNADGSDGFKQNRPDWPMPIHQLLVQHGVSAVFHGHDHLYVKQDLDGIVYQEVPQPGDPRGNTRTAAEYSYASGVILGSSGHLRVRVGPRDAKVEYIGAGSRNDAPAEVKHTYGIEPQRSGQPGRKSAEP